MAHPPSGESPLKIHNLVQLMAIGNLISKSANSSVCCLFFVYYLQMLTKTLRTNIEAVSTFQPQNFVVLYMNWCNEYCALLELAPAISDN
jgi:hypothetical protein